MRLNQLKLVFDHGYHLRQDHLEDGNDDSAVQISQRHQGDSGTSGSVEACSGTTF